MTGNGWLPDSKSCIVSSGKTILSFLYKMNIRFFYEDDNNALQTVGTLFCDFVLYLNFSVIYYDIFYLPRIIGNNPKQFYLFLFQLFFSHRCTHSKFECFFVFFYISLGRLLFCHYYWSFFRMPKWLWLGNRAADERKNDLCETILLQIAYNFKWQYSMHPKCGFSFVADEFHKTSGFTINFFLFFLHSCLSWTRFCISIEIPNQKNFPIEITSCSTVCCSFDNNIANKICNNS